MEATVKYGGKAVLRIGNQAVIAKQCNFLNEHRQIGQTLSVMDRKKAKWLIYTVLVGLLPVISRSIAWLVTQDGTVDLLASSDFVALGLILHISNINEIEHITNIDESWKTLQNGLSIAFIVFYSVFFCIALIGRTVVKQDALTYCSIALASVSLLISYSVYDRVAKIGSIYDGTSR